MLLKMPFTKVQAYLGKSLTTNSYKFQLARSQDHLVMSLLKCDLVISW